MTAFVVYDDLEPSTDRESKSGHKRIPKPSAVYVLGACLDDEFAALFVAGQESIENRKVDVRRGPDLGRSRSTLAVRRCLGKPPDKPATEPSRSDLLHRGIWLVFNRGGNRRHIEFIRDAEMLKTLSNAPATGRRLPIELFIGESSNQRVSGLVICA